MCKQVRSMLIEHVNQYAELHATTKKDVWKKLIADFEDEIKIPIRDNAERLGLTVLDYSEQKHKLARLCLTALTSCPVIDSPIDRAEAHRLNRKKKNTKPKAVQLGLFNNLEE